MTATQLAAGGDTQLINWWNLRWVALALAVMVGAIVAGNAFFLNFVHVMSGVMWTGIDIFMGFVIGPVLRQTDVPARRAIPWPWARSLSVAGHCLCLLLGPGHKRRGPLLGGGPLACSGLVWWPTCAPTRPEAWKPRS